ncbi:macrolide ABC transporter ATP-binding protein [Methylomonas sp. LWB]|uniref:ABC transporter ATP-binding protein n=1 Tax=Methylomonas sp. LWB TaxID=1905845 RepID=UPI0008DA7728|nr:ABC transporter ATP-binding protein [Methylomonas sp. LWB]OHX36374.1 macrolide ABC transporter ATP-binding protein [Methylomonas sp. LWB]
MPVIKTRGVIKDYPLASGWFRALHGVDLDIRGGEYVAVMGHSGSGKSTFMNILGCLDRCNEGSYWLNSHEVGRLSGDELARLRNQTLGFVFQGFNLLPRMTLTENVALPLVYAGIAKPERFRRARELLEKVGLARHVDAFPTKISGGQQQRVAIARALVNRPRVILADEPTGNLDSRTSDDIMSIFRQLHEEGITIVLVTHESDVAEHASRQVYFRDGRILSDQATLRAEDVPC